MQTTFPTSPGVSLSLHSPSGCMFESGAQQEIGVKEEVTQVAIPLAHIHHKAVTHQLTSLQTHPYRHTHTLWSEVHFAASVIVHSWVGRTGAHVNMSRFGTDKPHQAVTERDLSFTL